MNTLLEIAKARTPKERRNMDITDQHIELAIAWAKDEITYSQVLAALFGNNKGTMQAYVVLARALREGIRRAERYQKEVTLDVFRDAGKQP